MQIMSTTNTNARQLVVGSSGRFVKLDRIQLQNMLLAQNAEIIPLVDLMVVKISRT